jgi:hypothetical protein
MHSDVHERARYLIEEELIGALSEEDAGWLRNHTADCVNCAGYAEAAAKMLGGIRSLSFEVDPAMNRRVREAIMTHARQLAVERGRRPGVFGHVPRPPRTAWAAAALVLLAAAPIYRSVRDKRKDSRVDASDQALLESIAAKVARAVPEALEPLRQPPSPDAPDTPRGGVGGSQ